MFMVSSRVVATAVNDHVRTLAFHGEIARDRPHRPQTTDQSTAITNDDTPQMYTDSDNTGCPTVPMTCTIETDTDARRENLEELVWSHRTEGPTRGESR
jgi:hypothetical protein